MQREEKLPRREHEKSAEDAALRRLETARVQDVLERLGLRDRTILFRRFAGFRYAEIACIIGIEPTAVGPVPARARFQREYQRQER